MAKTATTTGTSIIKVVEQNTGIAVGSTTSTLTHSIDVRTDEASGTGASQNNLAWSDEATTAGTVSLDLNAGLTSKLDTGTVLAFDKLTRITFYNDSATPGETFQVGANANAVPIFGDVADFQVVGPGGKFEIVNPIDGFQVTAATGDILAFTATSGTIPYRILLTGRTV